MRPYVAELAHVAPCLVSVPSERRPAERVRRLRRDARRDERAAARVRARRLPEHRRQLLRLDARAHRGDRRRGARASRRGRSRRGARGRAGAASSRSRSAPDTGFVLIGERTNVTGSARFRRLVEADDFSGAVEVALEQVRGGANVLDVNMDADLLDGEQAMRTFLNVIATEPEVARLPMMVDSSKWTVLEAGLQCDPGQGDRQLDQPQGGRGRVPRARAARARLRRRRRRDGVRRGGPGDGRRAPRRDLRARVRPARRRGRLPAGGHRLRPERARRRDRDRGARRVRQARSSRRCR